MKRWRNESKRQEKKIQLLCDFHMFTHPPPFRVKFWLACSFSWKNCVMKNSCRRWKYSFEFEWIFSSWKDKVFTFYHVWSFLVIIASSSKFLCWNFSHTEKKHFFFALLRQHWLFVVHFWNSEAAKLLYSCEIFFHSFHL